MIEHERSFCFTHEGAHQFLQEHDMSLCYKSDDPDPSIQIIQDYYLRKGLRVRKSWTEKETTSKNTTTFRRDRSTNIIEIGHSTLGGLSGLSPKNAKYVLTRKQGEKRKGYRFELEEEISESVANTLMCDSIMKVDKVRKKLPVSTDEYLVTMDFIETPMQIAILEIEANNEASYPVPHNIAEKIFGTQLKECPLCAYSLFNRKIGICGGPSSGKSETSKQLSYLLNTQYNANAFHVTEFATTFIQKYHKTPDFWDQFFIWYGQHNREENANKASVVISDCPTFLSYIYLLHLPKEQFSTQTALMLAKLYKRVLFDVLSYSDIIFLNLVKYSENNVRYQSESEAKKIETKIKTFLDEHNILYHSCDYTQVNDILKDLFYINS